MPLSPHNIAKFWIPGNDHSSTEAIDNNSERAVDGWKYSAPDLDVSQISVLGEEKAYC
jgi:hypothetical protein